MQQQPKLEPTVAELKRMLSVMEDEILPKTRKQVAEGNKVFGAAILDGTTANLDTIVADTNHETLNPLNHGEIYVINQWAEKTPASERGGNASKAIFLATHEPCCLCISGIVWSGFKKVYYLFPYTVTADQGIPHDLDIMHELWAVDSYQKRNKFCSTASIGEAIEELADGPEKEELRKTVARVTEHYNELAKKYHSEKASNEENSLAFG